MKEKVMQGKPYAGNPHVRFDEGAGAPRHSGRPALLYYKLVAKRRFGLFVAVAAMSIVARGEVAWSVVDGAGTAEGGGDLVFAESLLLNSLSVSATGGAIGISGLGITFEGATPSITLRGKTVFDIPLTAAGTLAFDIGDTSQARRTYDAAFLTTADKVIFTGMDLSSYYIVSGVSGGQNIVSDRTYRPFHVQREQGTLIAQMQLIDGAYAKCLKVRLTQSGQNVVGRVLYARYSGAIDYGMDFDTEPYTAGYAIATGDANPGYGIGSITLTSESESFAATARKSVSAGSISIGDVDLSADGDGVLDVDGIITQPIAVGGSLAVTNASDITFSNVLSGAGTLYLGGSSLAGRNLLAEVTHDEALPTAWTTVATGAFVEGLTNAYVNTFLGTSIQSTPGGWIYNMRDSALGGKIGQIQKVEGSYIKCIYLEFRQVSTNVQARVVSVWYASSVNGLGVDFDTLDITTGTPAAGTRRAYNTGTNPSASVYGIASFTMYFDTDRDCSVPDRVTFAAANGMSGACIYQRGGIVRITHNSGLPSSSSMYEVSSGGTLMLDAAGCALNRGISDGKTRLYAREGSTIALCQGSVADTESQKIYLDASILDIYQNVNTYVNSLVLANGSRVVGSKPPLLAYNMSPTWKVEGSSPSYVKTALTIASTLGHTCTFDVADVTGDGEADFIIEGNMMTYDATQHTNVYARKIGAGTMAFFAPMRLYAPLLIDEGTVRVCVSSALGGTYPKIGVKLGGGALEMADGTVNTAGVLSVTNDSSIIVGEGATLAFDDSSAAVWTSGKQLTINAPDAKSVRFGTNSSALTDGQKRAMRINGTRAALDDAGYVIPYIPGMMLIVK